MKTTASPSSMRTGGSPARAIAAASTNSSDSPRVQAAYDLITQGKAKHTAPDALSGLEQAYARGESDEFVEATAIARAVGAVIHEDHGVAVLHAHGRFTRAFIEDAFDGFPRAPDHPRLHRG